MNTQEVTNILCPNCGEPLPEGGSFCIKCGTKYEPPKRKLPWKLIAPIAAAIVIALVFFCYIFPTFISPKMTANKAETAIAAGEYATAIELYEEAELEEDEAHAASYNYAKGMVEFNDGGYMIAAVLFSDAEGLLDADEHILLCAKELLKEENYDNSEICLSYLDTAEADELQNFISAERLFHEGKMASARPYYKNLPADFTFEGIAAKDRLAALDAYPQFEKLCGKWDATDSYIETKNVYKRSGSWDSWYNDSLMSGQYVDIKCIPQNNGTIVIRGEVAFCRFTTFSSLREYNDKSTTPKSFSIYNLTEIPSEYWVDDYTKLTFKEDRLILDYYEKDNYSNSFYNEYSSSVIYGKKTTDY